MSPRALIPCSIVRDLKIVPESMSAAPKSLCYGVLLRQPKSPVSIFPGLVVDTESEFKGSRGAEHGVFPVLSETYMRL